MALDSSPERPAPLGRVIQAVKGWVERCGWVWVEAEITELNRRNGPTQFLTLRDKLSGDTATVTCSRQALDASGPLTVNTTVVASLKPVLWASNATFSFECREFRIVGEGRLLAQVEQLKRALQAEGLFDPARKRRPPRLPRRIGLITGAGSAAEKDVLTTLAARWPAVSVEVRHATVQGPDAAGQVMEQLAILDAIPDVDVLIIARGGGSFEDLLPFSNEGLVRAVSRCRTPVVSAIGHQSDSPILDLVADLAAITPTDAAKRVVPDVGEEKDQVQQQLNRLRQSLVQGISTRQSELTQLRSRPVLRDPMASFEPHVERLELFRTRLSHAIDRQLGQEVTMIDHALTRVRSMSPKATLERGYAILVDGAGESVSSVADTDQGDDLMAYLADGTLVLEVRESQSRAAGETGEFR